jgi:hypothetical protein
MNVRRALAALVLAALLGPVATVRAQDPEVDPCAADLIRCKMSSALRDVREDVARGTPFREAILDRVDDAVRGERIECDVVLEDHATQAMLDACAANGLTVVSRRSRCTPRCTTC